MLGCVAVNVESSEEEGSDAASASVRSIPGDSFCAQDSDCLPDAVCIAGKCGRQCVQDADCAQGLLCSGFRCVLDPEPVFVDASASDTMGSPKDSANSEPDVGQAAPVDVFEPTPALPYGSPCEAQEECQSGLCLKAGDAPGICTKNCTVPLDCPGTDTCYPVGSESVCAPNDSGTPCSVGCYSALSLNNETGQCVCAASCTDANKCPAGFGCGLVATPTGNQKVCVAVGVQCMADQPSPCFDKCVSDNGGLSGYCTTSCQSALDCPSGWLCDATLSVCYQ